MVSPMLATRATGRRSAAPALDLMTVGVTDAPPRLGMTMPWAPHSSAERITAPRLCGSSMPSLSTRKGGSPFALAAASRSSTEAYSISLANAATP